MKINVFDNYNQAYNLDIKSIVKKIRKAFKIRKRVNLILVTNEEIRRLNKNFREIDSATDVLSFPVDEKKYLGDIFISIDKMLEQANSYEHSNEREFAFLVVHGILHLLGYDHNNHEEEKEMFKKQDQILNKIGIGR